MRIRETFVQHSSLKGFVEIIVCVFAPTALPVAVRWQRVESVFTFNCCQLVYQSRLGNHITKRNSVYFSGKFNAQHNSSPTLPSRIFRFGDWETRPEKHVPVSKFQAQRQWVRLTWKTWAAVSLKLVVSFQNRAFLWDWTTELDERSRAVQGFN